MEWGQTANAINVTKVMTSHYSSSFNGLLTEDDVFCRQTIRTICKDSEWLTEAELIKEPWGGALWQITYWREASRQLSPKVTTSILQRFNPEDRKLPLLPEMDGLVGENFAAHTNHSLFHAATKMTILLISPEPTDDGNSLWQFSVKVITKCSSTFHPRISEMSFIGCGAVATLTDCFRLWK